LQKSKVPALAVASEGCLRSVPGAQAQALPGSGPVDGGNGKLAQASTPFALCSMTRQQRKSLALDGGSCRFSMMTRKAKPRRQGEVDHSCLSLAVGLPVMPTLQPPTDVAVGSDNIRLPSSVISELPCCSERQSGDDRAPPLYQS
jgi:hypothetical protein